jgi:hypothetical protein
MIVDRSLSQGRFEKRLGRMFGLRRGDAAFKRVNGNGIICNSMKGANQTLQDFLLDHLTRSDKTTYQKIELKIVAIEEGVVKVTDDYKHMFELRGRPGSSRA